MTSQVSTAGSDDTRSYDARSYDAQTTTTKKKSLDGGKRVVEILVGPLLCPVIHRIADLADVGAGNRICESQYRMSEDESYIELTSDS